VAAVPAESEPSAGHLDTLCFGVLSADGRVDALIAAERHVRHAHAVLARALGELDRAQEEEASWWIPAAAAVRASSAP
jgi:hypothetical protein